MPRLVFALKSRKRTTYVKSWFFFFLTKVIRWFPTTRASLTEHIGRRVIVKRIHIPFDNLKNPFY